MSTLTDAISLLVHERHEAARLNELLKIRRVHFEYEIAGEVEQANAASQAARDADEALREIALDIYAEKGDKHVAAGVEIKFFQVPNYSTEAAFAWAVDHRLCLSLDKRAFEATVKANPTSFSFVEIAQEARAQIATDLEVLP